MYNTNLVFIISYNKYEFIMKDNIFYNCYYLRELRDYKESEGIKVK